MDETSSPEFFKGVTMENPLVRSRSLAPDFVLNPPDWDGMPFGIYKSFYLSVVDEARNSGISVEREEAIMASYLEGGTDEVNFRLGTGADIERTIQGLRGKYDVVTGLGFYPDMRQRITTQILEYLEKYGKLPSINAVVIDLDQLHDKNIKHTKSVVNKGFRKFARHLINAIEDIPPKISDRGSVSLVRQKGTGDEMLAIFVDNSEAAEEFIKNLSERKWPFNFLPLKNDRKNRKKVIFSARYAHIDLNHPEIIKLMEGTVINHGLVVERMIELGEEVNDSQGHQRGHKRVKKHD